MSRSAFTWALGALLWTTAGMAAQQPLAVVSATSVHSATYPVAFAIDGDAKTRWASEVGAERIDDLTLDFGVPCKQAGLRLSWEAAYAAQYEVQLSDDGRVWRTVFTQAKGKGGVETCDFPEAAARFLRVHCTKPGPHPLYSLWEVEPLHPEAQAGVKAAHEQTLALRAEGEKRFRSALTAAGVQSVVFALRTHYAGDGHWYANIGYYSFDDGKKLHTQQGQLCRLDLESGKVVALVDDPEGAVRDPTVHYDAQKILFSYRKGGTDCYHLYEINVDGTGLKQLTDGPRDDFEPCYLPDGGIVFVSTRGDRWVNCWATQVATLHRCDGDGRNIRMISANLEQDNTPAVLPGGRILYQRWEYVDRSQVDYHHLWTMNPDGTGQMVYYGNQRTPGLYIDAKPIPGSEEVLFIDSPGHGGREHAGNLALLTAKFGPDEPTANRHIPNGGNCRDPFPFTRDAALVARGAQLLCMSHKGDTFEVYKVPEDLARKGVQMNEPVPVMKRPRELVIPSRVDVTQTKGRLLLSNAYVGRNMDGVKPGLIKKLLVMESLPKPINYTGGMDPLTYGGSFTLERILGTVPVDADGSANFEVPANRALFLIAMDGEGNSIKRMQSFLTVMPGESLACVGCHEYRTGTQPPASGKSAFLRPPSIIAPVPDVPDVFDFPRDIQPILDRHCVRCHNPDKHAGSVCLDGGRGPLYSHSYVALTVRKQFKDGRNLPKSNYPPYSLGATVSPLMKKLDGDHHEVKVSPVERELIRYWIESAAAYIGTYAALATGAIGGYQLNNQVLNNDTKWPESQKAGEAIQRRCASCHQGAKRIPLNLTDERGVSFWRPNWDDPALVWSRHFLFNLSKPEKSLVLLAPLAKAAGGCGTMLKDGQPVELFKDTADPDYQAILAMLQAGQRRLEEVKRFDMPDFQPRPEYLREMKRYGILPADFDLDRPPKVNPYTLDRLYWDASSRDTKAIPGYRLLTADVDTCEVTKRDRSGAPVWVYTQVRPIDAWPQPDNAVLIAYLPSPRTGNKGGVRLVSDAKQTLFDCPFNDEIMSCQPLTNGNILVNECGAGRVTELTPKGESVRSFDVKAKGKGHATARLIRLTPQGTVLVAECYSHKLREYDLTGALLKEWDFQMVYGASRLPNGHTLVSCYKPAAVYEVTPEGKTVWSLTAADLPKEMNLAQFGEAQRLPNGNTLVACCSRGVKGPRAVAFEVTPDKQVVWKETEPERIRETTSVKIIPEESAVGRTPVARSAQP